MGTPVAVVKHQTVYEIAWQAAAASLRVLVANEQGDDPLLGLKTWQTVLWGLDLMHACFRSLEEDR